MCNNRIFDASFLTLKQVSSLIVANFILMAANILANALVIYILIKAKQILQITYKLVFMLSASDILIVILSQSLITAIFIGAPCLIYVAFTFVATFLSHMSNYIISILGVDRYFRIKHYATFRAMWTTKVVSKLMCIVFFLALIQAVTITTGTLLGREYIAMSIYIVIDGFVIGTITFFQIKTIKTSNALQNQSTIVISNRINKKISKLSMQMMILSCIFTSPHLVLYIVREIIVDQLNDYERSIVEFVSFISLILTFANSRANAVLFLLTNVKARRLVGNFGR